MNIAIYSRKSRFSQSGDSIENQVQLCKDYAERYDYNDATFIVYEDEGFSGKNTNRPKFTELMNDIKNKKIDVLMCYRLDRISRNVADFSATLEILEQYNVSFVSIKEQFDTSTPMGRAMIYIASVFAQLERETIAERVRDNMIELAKNGYWLGGTTPLGYKSIPLNYIDNDMTERKMFKLENDEDEIKIVRLIYDKYIELKSMSKVETYLIQNNIKTRKNGFYSVSSIHFILTNPVYVKANADVIEYLHEQGMYVCGIPNSKNGILIYNKTKTSTGKAKDTRDISEWIAAISNHPGIFDADTWLSVQKISELNKGTYPNMGKTHNALLTGIIKCKCGSFMRINHGHISVKTGKCIYYYSCAMKKRSKGDQCQNGNARVDEIDEAVLKYLESVGFNKNELLEECRTSNNVSKPLVVENNNKKELQDLVASRKKQIDTLINKLSIADDPEVDAMLFKKIRELKDEVSKYELELKKINDIIKSKENDSIAYEMINILLNKCGSIRELDHDSQKQLIQLFFKSIVWDSESNVLTLTPHDNIIEITKKKVP